MLVYNIAVVGMGGLLLLAACKSEPPEEESSPQAKSPKPNVDYATACDGLVEDIPFTTAPLGGRIGGNQIPIVAEVVRGGVALVSGDDRLVLTVGGSGRRPVRVSAGEEAGTRGKRPAIRGSVPGFDGGEVRYGALKLKLEPMVKGRSEGNVVLCLDQPTGYIAGSFEARVDEDFSDSPDATRPHVSTLRYLSERSLAKTRSARKFRHRGAWIDAERGVGYDHVVVRGDPRQVVTNTFKRAGDKWKIARSFAGTEVPEAHPEAPPETPDGKLVVHVARRLEKTLNDLLGDGTFVSRIVAETQDGRGKVRVYARPDKKGAQAFIWAVDATLDERGEWSIGSVKSQNGTPVLAELD